MDHPLKNLTHIKPGDWINMVIEYERVSTWAVMSTKKLPT